MSLRKTIASATLATALVVGGSWISTGTLRAADHDHDCAARVEHERAKLDHAIRRHGEHSRQAEKERHRLRDLEERCSRYQHYH